MLKINQIQHKPPQLHYKSEELLIGTPQAILEAPYKLGENSRSSIMVGGKIVGLCEEYTSVPLTLEMFDLRLGRKHRVK